MALTALALAVLALVLAWPVPVALSVARWPRRAPALALVLWQSIAIAGGLSMIGAFLAVGLLPFGSSLRDATATFAVDLVTGTAVAAPLPNLLALTAGFVLAAHLLLTLVLTVARAETQRRRHAQLIDLLSTTPSEHPGTRVIDTAAPVAYCLPGPFRTVTVLSAGLIALLEKEQLAAVLEHERAHVVQRHDIVLIAFRAWRASLPWFPIAARALGEVELLIELLADERAVRIHGAPTLRFAVARVATAGDAQPSPTAVERLARLDAPAPPLSSLATTAIAALAVGLVVLPTVLIGVQLL